MLSPIKLEASMTRPIFLAVFLVCSTCLGQDLEISTGMTRVEFAETIKKLEGSDISSAMEITGSHPGVYWAIKDYGIVIEVGFKDERVSSLAYWKKAEFEASKLTRDQQEKEITRLRFNGNTKQIIVDPPPATSKVECIQPDYKKWLTVKAGMTEDEVKKILGEPLSESKVPQEHINDPTYVKFMTYGRIHFDSPSLPDTFEFAVVTKLGKVSETIDPFGGILSTDGKPTTPVPISPNDRTVFDHYPRFVDLRWTPSAGEYPIEYTIEVQYGFLEYAADGKTTEYQYRMTDQQESEFPYKAISFVGKGPGRWRVKAKNKSGESDWCDWRFFRFQR